MIPNLDSIREIRDIYHQFERPRWGNQLAAIGGNANYLKDFESEIKAEEILSTWQIMREIYPECASPYENQDLSKHIDKPSIAPLIIVQGLVKDLGILLNEEPSCKKASEIFDKCMEIVGFIHNVRRMKNMYTTLFDYVNEKTNQSSQQQS